jgi:hypothetical protein
MVSMLEARANDPVAKEIRAFVNALDEERQIDLVALTWLGRGDYDIGGIVRSPRPGRRRP